MEEDTAPLRSAASQWSLAGDKQLLGVLQNIHERLVSRCQETNKRLGEMAAALDNATVDLHNVNNKFMALSNTQFIESRVYDDDEEAAPPPDTAKEPKIPMDTTSEIEKIKLGLKVLESMHEPLHILHDTDSESDEDDEVSRMVLKPKDPYAHRPLPYIIGSYAWQNKWHAGLLPEDSDTDSSVTKHDSREEYSDSEPESTGNIQTDKLHVPDRTLSTASSDMMSEELPSASPVVKPSPSDIAAELARRLGGHTAKIAEPEMEYTPPVPTTKKIYKPEKPATSTIFSDEPPPLEHSYSDKDDYSQEEDDDIFAELNKNKPYSQNSRVQSQVTEDLFGGLGKTERTKNDGDIFSDFKEPPESANQKSTLFSDESEPELFAEKSQPKPTKHDTPQEVSSVKKPVGGISLFGNKGTESIGAAILKRNQRQSSIEEDTANDETTSHKQVAKEKDIFDDLFAKSEKEQRKVQMKVEKVDKEVAKEVKKEKKVDLFSDNLFDDIDDIFTSNIPKVPIKEASKNQKSIFDDEDDLFSNVAVTKDTKSEIKTSNNIERNIFDSDDELFTEKPVAKPSESQKINVKPVSENQVSKTAKSIFDDSSDSDIFSDVKEPVSEKKPVNILGNSKKEVVRNERNVEKVTTNIMENTLVENKTNSEDKISAQTIQKSIFEDKNIPAHMTKKSTFDENDKIPTHIAKKSIFDEDDDIFKAIPSTNSQSSKLLHVVADVVPAEDIFESIKQNINDDLKEPVSKMYPVNILGNSKKDVVRSDRNVEKITTNITDNTLVENITNSEDNIPTQTIQKSIFEDDNITHMTKKSIFGEDDDILESIKQNKNEDSRKMFENVLHNDSLNESSKQNVKKLAKAQLTKLFDNDSEEELFSNKSKEKNNYEIVQNEPKSKATDEYEGNVLINTNITNQNSTEGSQNTKTEDTLFSKENDAYLKINKPNTNDVKNIVYEKEIDDLFTKCKNVETLTDISKEETDSILVEGNNDIWEDDLFQNNKTQEIIQAKVNFTDTKTELTFKEKLGEESSTNLSTNDEHMNDSVIKIVEALEKTPNILEKGSLITENVESKISKHDNTNDNNVNSPQDSLFFDETNVKNEKVPVFTEQNDPSFNKSDILSDILSEPPEFEKPKEPKKSKNVNALFDDDSDDEALFFKKNDPTLDDKPEYSSPTAENRLFGLFHDEPPALEVDFVQKTDKTFNLDDVPKDQVDFNDFAKSETVVMGKETKIPESPMSENECLFPVSDKIIDQPNDTKKDSSNRIGKLKTMNFSINVNALLPGASPKRAKAVEKAKEPTHTKSEVDIRIKDSSKHEIESKLVKSISFDGKPESQVLDNSLSKERAKIQVKRRPSTRRARKEAVRKSAIDLGGDSTDHSSSIDDTPRTNNSENDLKATIDSENVTNSLNYDSLVGVEDLKPDVLPLDSNAIEKLKSEIEPKATEVKTKTVYILNDEDIFDIEPKSDTKQTLNTQVLNVVDDDLLKNKLEPSKTKDASQLDVDVNERLFKTSKVDRQAENIDKKISDDSEILFTNPKSKNLNIVDDDDDLTKVNTNTGVNTLGKVYKDTKSIDAEAESLYTVQHKSTRDNDTRKVKNTKNLKEMRSVVDESIRAQTEEIKDKTASTDKINYNIHKQKEVKKVSIFDLSDDENELFNKNAKSVPKSVFDSDSDEDLFNRKGAVVKKETRVIKERDVKVKVDVKGSLFGDDDDDDLFGVKTKKSNNTATQSTQSTAKEAAIKTTEPVFDDPLSLLGGDTD